MEEHYGGTTGHDVPLGYYVEGQEGQGDDLPTLADLNMNSSSQGAVQGHIENATWRCLTPGDSSGPLEWLDQIPSLLHGIVTRRYSALVLSHSHGEWFAQVSMENNQIPYVELGMRVEDAYNQVFRFSPLQGSGMRVLEVLEIMENYVQSEAFPAAGKYRLDVYYY